MLNKNKLGLVLGLFFALVHSIWIILVALAPQMVQQFLNWISALKHIQPGYVLETFNLTHALTLIAFSFIFAYILGWLFAAIWNGINRQ